MSRTDAFLIDQDGNRTLYVGPALTEGLPPHVLEGLTRRRLMAMGHPCPCGAAMTIPNREQRRKARKGGSLVLDIRIEHEDDCEAICPELLDGRWSA